MNSLTKITTFLLVLTWGISSGQKAQNQPIPLDPAVKTGKLANGFTYYIRKNTEPKDRVQLYLVNKVGSILENDDQQGLAHFLEHMSFNGTTHFPKNELVSYLQKAGVRFGADLNAYTSFDETVYQLPLPTDDEELLRNGIQIMRDWAQEVTLAEDEINKERGIILEEKRMGKGAQQRMQEKSLPVLFNNSQYSKRLPIGTEEVIMNFKPETIRGFYHDWYRPDLQALIVVGDIDVDKIENIIKEKFSDLKMPANPKERKQYTIPLTGKNQFIAVTDKEFPVLVMQVMIKQPEAVIIISDDYRKSIERNLFNQMLSDRYSELSNQADPPFIQGGANMSGFMAGLDAFSAHVVAKPGELEKGFKAVWRETERVKQLGFTQTELDRAKNSFLTSIESAFREKDKTASGKFVTEYQKHFLNGNAAPGIDAEFKLVQEQLPGITLTRINELCKIYISDVNRDVVIMAPEKELASLPDKATVDTWIKSIQNEKLTAYVDLVSDKPLVAKIPAAGQVTSEKKINELNVTELTLSNGVKVVLKPTDFKTDEIQFNAFSPGGTSLYSDADYQSADNAARIINSSGLGDFNYNELPKLLNGKIVYVAPFISELSEGINGFTTPKDLETALQLTYLYFTEPRKDTVIYSGFINRSKSGLANRADDPKSVFNDTVSAIMGNYNIRRTGPSIAKIEQIKLEKAYAVYKERFADASDFTFIFIGNFDVEQIKPLLAQWLGSLPSIKRAEQAKDLGIQIPSGFIEKKVYKGTEIKATEKLVFSGDYLYNQSNNIQLEALGEVLKIKLVERLREKESGVYSPFISSSYTKLPQNRYTISVEFGCAPDNVEHLFAATIDEMNKIKKKGADATDIQKIIAEATRANEINLKQNSFWLNYLSTSYENRDDPKEILGYIEAFSKVTPKSMKKAAKTYLSGKNIVKLVLLPEKGK